MRRYQHKESRNWAGAKKMIIQKITKQKIITQKQQHKNDYTKLITQKITKH